MPTLLLELFSEEIPSRMQRGAAEQLQRLVLEGFKKSGLSVDAKSAKTFVSPRHLAIQVFGLPSVQPDVKEERRGPKIGAPEQALKGFLQSTGLTLDQCEQRDGYYYATIERKGRAVADVVKEICESALPAFSWPKSMHWGSRDARPLAWVRPLHRIACLLDDAVVPVQFGHLTASNVTEGHRFLAPAPITIAHAENYEAQLIDAKIIVDFAARRTKIAAEIAAVARLGAISPLGEVETRLGVSGEGALQLVQDEDLLNEVAGLVEWPVPLLCEFDAKFLDLPPEVLISEMKNHQRYFALTDASGSPRHSSEGATAGKLTNQFITVANMVNADGGAKVREGNARVVRARLADGEFYWEQDRKTSLEDWGKKLSDVVFHAKVGMMDAKVERIEALAVAIAKAVGFTDEKSVRRAAQLCKADLTSGMVGEFPELQGIMGRYYTDPKYAFKGLGESQEISDAIRDHYVPRGASAKDAKELEEQSELSGIIAIADKLDSITSLFAAGEKPTGSKDPLALRRAALGVLRILNHHKRNLDIAPLIDVKLRKEVIEFFKDRLKQLLKEEGYSHDVIEAVMPKEVDTFVSELIFAKARLVSAWLSTDSGKATLAAIKRAMNILAAEEKKDKNLRYSGAFGDKALNAAVEWELLDKLGKAPRSLKGLESLTETINRFFTEVLVTEPEYRVARLSLLAGIRELANQIADFSKIEG
jgi:glycyl-tRNA synthetase beta chain